jgi:hypothetical protein
VVGDNNNTAAPDFVLEQQNITRDEPFVLWEWVVYPNTRIADTDTWFEGNFLSEPGGAASIQTFLTNNEYQPTFNMCVGETVHYRLLCAQTTTGSAIYILDENDSVIPFWVFASDGIAYDKAYEKTVLVVGPGQREALLLQFLTAGTYRVMQNPINDFQDTGEIDPDGNPAAPAGFIVVSDANCSASPAKPVNISSLEFTPGMTGDITNEQVKSQISVNFQVESQLDRVPVPQFVIDGTYHAPLLSRIIR